MSMERSKLKEFIDEIIQEIEHDLDEATTSGAAGAYSTPNAFSDGGSKDKKLKKKIATQLGMKLVGKVDEELKEATFRPNSGTMSGGTYGLDNRKYELKRDVKGVRIGDYTNVTLPKGTIIYNIPGGVFAHHRSLKSYESGQNKYFNQSTFRGISVRQEKNTVISIEKNSKILESVNEEKYFSLKKGDKLKVKHPEYKNLIFTIIKPKGSGYEYIAKHTRGSDKNWAPAGYFSSAIKSKDAELIESINERNITRSTERVLQKGIQSILGTSVNQEMNDNGAYEFFVDYAEFVIGVGEDETKKAKYAFSIYDDGARKYLAKGKSNDEKDLIKQILSSVKKFKNKLLLTTESVNESKKPQGPVNRWLAIKNDETKHPHKKMAMGLKELKYQLGETQKFFTWYNQIKSMNELDSSDYWKRTNKHIYKIKERLINIAKTIQEIEK